MQVRAGCEAGHSDVADDLAEIHVLAAAQLARETRQVPIDRDDPGSMFEFYDVSKSPLAANEFHVAVTGRPHGSAHRCGVVDAAVSANRVQHGMSARRVESRAHAGKLHRCSYKCLTQAPAIGSEVLGVALRIHVAHRSIFTTLVDELCSEDVA